MGSFCGSGNTVTQQQTYRPDPRATSAISGALSQAQTVGQTPFQTPVAPVAGFSPQQQQAFDLTGQAQGQAQPYIDEATQYFGGNRVNQFLNPFASNVMAGLKDIFGAQQQQTTGNLTQQAGGVGADRIAVGQAELARQQGLSAGQTLAGLYQPALSASQNAGFGIGSLGPVAQNASLQGAQALLGTGGLQQQLAQAQMNAPYQNILARIQWPYQNAQFNAGITGALAPGLGGTTTGNTAYPPQSPWGTIAGLGMAGLGAYGAAGGTGLGTGMSNLGGGYNWDGSMSGDQWVAAGQGQGPYAARARGGRINPYAPGGVVDLDKNDDGSYGDDQIHSAEIKALQDEGNPSAVGTRAPPMPSVHPIDVSAGSLVPTGQIPQIQPHIPQLSQPQQQSGSGLDSIAKIAATVAPFLLSRGGRAGYAEGGRANPFDPTGRERPDPIPEGEGFWRGFLREAAKYDPLRRDPIPEGEGFWRGFLREAAKYAPLALGVRGGVNLRPMPPNYRNPQLRVGNRFAAHTDEPRWAHPAVMNSPVAAGVAATSALDWEHPKEDWPEPAPVRHYDADHMAGAENPVSMGAPRGDSFEDRFGGMAPPSAHHEEPPSWLQGAQERAPQREPMIPIPRSNPFAAMAVAHEQKKRETANPFAIERERPPIYRPLHMAEGGEVDDELLPDESGPFATNRQRALEASSPFDIAAMRTRESVRPTSGRKEGPLMGMAGTGLMLVGGPEAIAARYAPRTAAAVYGMLTGAGPTEAGEPAATAFVPPAPTADETKEIARINGLIAPKKVQLEKAIKISPYRDPKKDPNVIAIQSSLDSLMGDMAGIQGPNSPLGLRRAAALDVYNKLALKKGETDLGAQEAERWSKLPYAEKYPERQAWLQKNMPTASGMTGTVLGLLGRGKVLKPLATSLAAGAAEGAATAAWPTLQDTEFLPEGQTWKQATDRLYNADPDFLKRVGASAGTHALIAGGGSLIGSKTRDFAGQLSEGTSKALSRAPKALPEAAEKATEIAKTMGAKAKPTAKMSEVTLPDGSIVKRYDYSDGKTRWYGTTPSGRKGYIKPPMMQASGGRVNSRFADGGDTSDWTDLVERQNLADSPYTRMNNWGADYQPAPAGKFPPSTLPPEPVDPDMDYAHGAFRPTQEAYGRKLSSGITGSAPVSAVEDEEFVEPPSRNPVPDNPYAAYAASPEGLTDVVKRAPTQARSLIDNPWMALVNAGLGTLAAAGTRDARGLPLSPAAAIGKGGMQGIETLQHQQQAAMKQQSVEQAARRLDQQAAFQMAQMTHHNAQLAESKRQHDFQQTKPFLGPMDERGFQHMFRYDPKTGQYVPWNPVGGSEKASRGISEEGIIPANAKLAEGSYDYATNAPYIEKGLDPPAPRAIAGKSAAALETDAESYLKTGKLPPVRSGRSPVAIAQQDYRNAVQNYGNAIAQSRGITPEQVAETWRTAPGTLRFILGPDGRSTVALGTAVRHLDTMRELAEAWKSGDVQALNRVRATLSREFGSGAVTNLEAAGRIVGPEIIKALGVAGAGTAEERLAAQKAFGTAATPDQFEGAIQTTQKLLGGQLEGRKRQAMNAGVSEGRFKSLIGDRPYEILSSAEKPIATTTSKELKIGDIRKGEDGDYRFKGGNRRDKANWEKVE